MKFQAPFSRVLLAALIVFGAYGGTVLADTPSGEGTFVPVPQTWPATVNRGCMQWGADDTCPPMTPDSCVQFGQMVTCTGKKDGVVTIWQYKKE